MKLVIITGMSGSGKSIALNALEDEGYYCIDNMPVFLLIAFATNLVANPDEHYRLTAIGIDARSNHENFSEIPSLVKNLRSNGVECQIVVLEAQPEVLIKRFSETRRNLSCHFVFIILPRFFGSKNSPFVFLTDI